jgi:hypothetical protein
MITNADCRKKQLDALQVTGVGVRVRVGVGVGVEQNEMLYKCSLSAQMLDKCSMSPQASIMELREKTSCTNADCRNKHQSWIWTRSMSHVAKSCSCDKLEVLPVLAVATNIK